MLPYLAGQPRALAVGADHDLQRPISMHAPKVEITLGRNVGYVGRDATLLAQLPDLRGRLRVVDGHENHVGTVEVGRLKVAVRVGDVSLGNPVGHLGVQAGGRRDDGDMGVGI